MYENCADCAIRKLRLVLLVVLVAICKFQIAVHKKALKKLGIKMLKKLTLGGSMGPRYVLRLLFSEKNTKLPVTQLV